MKMLCIAGFKILALKKAIWLKLPLLRRYALHLAAISKCYVAMTQKMCFADTRHC